MLWNRSQAKSEVKGPNEHRVYTWNADDFLSIAHALQRFNLHDNAGAIMCALSIRQQ
ncbi:hypothetical protein D3C85_1136810 [compost metagenome]